MPTTASERRGLRVIADRVSKLLASGYLRLPPSYTPDEIKAVKEIANRFKNRWKTYQLLTDAQLGVLNRAYNDHLKMVEIEEKKNRENIAVEKLPKPSRYKSNSSAQDKVDALLHKYKAVKG